MTLDEAIAHAREVAKENRKQIKPKCDYQNMPWIDDKNEACKKCAEEHEQLARWLEELKTYRELKDLIVLEARADAIDELVRFANTMPTIENDDGEIRPMWLEEMAEQLKEKADGSN